MKCILYIKKKLYCGPLFAPKNPRNTNIIVMSHTCTAHTLKQDVLGRVKGLGWEWVVARRELVDERQFGWRNKSYIILL